MSRTTTSQVARHQANRRGVAQVALLDFLDVSRTTFLPPPVDVSFAVVTAGAANPLDAIHPTVPSGLVAIFGVIYEMYWLGGSCVTSNKGCSSYHTAYGGSVKCQATFSRQTCQVRYLCGF